jgi:hypothetical protein
MRQSTKMLLVHLGVLSWSKSRALCNVAHCHVLHYGIKIAVKRSNSAQFLRHPDIYDIGWTSDQEVQLLQNEQHTEDL